MTHSHEIVAALDLCRPRWGREDPDQRAMEDARDAVRAFLAAGGASPFETGAGFLVESMINTIIAHPAQRGQLHSEVLSLQSDLQCGQLLCVLHQPETLRWLDGVVDPALVLRAATANDLEQAATALRAGARHVLITGEAPPEQYAELFQPCIEMLDRDETKAATILAERLIRFAGIPESATSSWLGSLDPVVVSRALGLDPDLTGPLLENLLCGGNEILTITQAVRTLTGE